MTEAKHRVGRPRETRVDDAISSAVRALVAERGYGALTVDAVATRAGVGKAAIYRRHATKQEMTFAVLLHDLHEEAPEDTGSLQGDLDALSERIGAQLARSSAEAMVGLLRDVRADSGLGRRFEATYLSVERGIVSDLLDRAVARGELAHAPDPRVVHALLLGPLFTWVIMLGEAPSGVGPLARGAARMVAEAVTSGADRFEM